MSYRAEIDSFKSGLSVVDSKRAHVLMLIGLFGGTGSGKSVTALIWAVGMVGPDALVGIVDTEQKRSTIAADIVEKMAAKHYGKAIPKIKVVHLDAPYHPLKYVAAMELLVASGCKAICADSLTHAWSGSGGYLDLKEETLQRMAGDDWRKREACAMAAAAKTKPQTHGKLFDAIIHLPVPAIMCFRAVEKTRMTKGETGKTEIKKDDYSTPIQESNLIFEMLISGECSTRDGIGGYCSFRGPGRKHTHPEILSLLPKEDEQFGFAHGERLAAWCSSPGGTNVGGEVAGGVASKSPAGGAKPASVATPADDLKKLKAELWKITQEQHGGKVGKLNVWLLDQGIIGDQETLEEIGVTRLQEVIAKTKEKIK
jgi:hypothetical protein